MSSLDARYIERCVFVKLDFTRFGLKQRHGVLATEGALILDAFVRQEKFRY